MGVLKEIEQAVADVARAVGPSVVGVGQRWGMGSGVVIEAGKVLTNAHNLRREEITVTFSDARTAAGRVAGVDVDGEYLCRGFAVVRFVSAGSNRVIAKATSRRLPCSR